MSVIEELKNKINELQNDRTKKLDTIKLLSVRDEIRNIFDEIMLTDDIDVLQKFHQLLQDIDNLQLFNRPILLKCDLYTNDNFVKIKKGVEEK